jgi:membrane protein DedA with SNARE-associated domain
MNKARPTMSGSLIKHRAYLKYIIIIIIIIIILVVVVVLTIIKKKRKKLMRTLRWKINVKVKQ